MAQSNKRVIRRLEVSQTVTGAGPTFISTLPGDTVTRNSMHAAGLRGVIRSVKVRMHTTSANATGTIDVWLVNNVTAAVVAIPDDLDVSFEKLGTAMTRHATTADIKEDLMANGGGSAYEVQNIGELSLVIRQTVGAGANVYIAMIELEVMSN